jgi:type II secretion system protein N
MMQKLALVAGGLAWGVLVFAIGFKVNFPRDALLERLRYEVQDRGEGKWALDAGSADIWFLHGVEFDDLVVYKVEAPKKPRPKKRRGKAKLDDGGEDAGEGALKGSTFFRADHARVSVALLPLLQGQLGADFAAEVLQGDLSGTYARSDAASVVQLAGEGLNLALLPLSGDDWSIDASGTAALDADLALDATDPKKSEGTLNLSIADFAIDKASIKGFDLSPTAFSEAKLEIALQEGKATIETGSLVSEAVQVELSGHATVNGAEPSRWRLRVQAKVTLGEDLDKLARMLPDMKEARGEDDAYHFICTGTLERPTCRIDRAVVGPARGAAGLGGAGGLKPRGRIGADDALGDGPGPASFLGPRGIEPSGDPEADREARLQRIRERREKLRKEREARAAGGEDIGMEPRVGPAFGPDGPGSVRGINGRRPPMDGEYGDGPPVQDGGDDYPPEDVDPGYDGGPPPDEDFPAEENLPYPG